TEITPVAAHVINDMGGILSKSAAIKQGKYAGNTALWDGAPKLSHPTHNKLYDPSGEMPDTVAQSAFEAGLIADPSVDTLWQAIARESKTVRTVAAETRKQNLLAKQATKGGPLVYQPFRALP